jgi:hypothetical protein
MQLRLSRLQRFRQPSQNRIWCERASTLQIIHISDWRIIKHGLQTSSRTKGRFRKMRPVALGRLLPVAVVSSAPIADNTTPTIQAVIH